MAGHFWITMLSMVFMLVDHTSSQELLIGAVTGLRATVPCEHGRNREAPFWTINGTVYELLSIPRHFPFIPVVHSYAALIIPFVYLSLDQTTFQCLSFDENGDVSGMLIRLMVVPNVNGVGINEGYEDIEINELVINYQKLLITEDSITVAWSLNDSCTSTFEVCGYTLNTGVPVLVSSSKVGDTRSFTINSSHLTNDSTGVDIDIDYRLVALAENGTECPSSREIYYRFSAVEFEQTIIENEAINSTCYTIPKRSICTERGQNFVWPARAEGRSCVCPVYNSSAGRRVFESCVEGCRDAVLTPSLGEDGEVCISNLSSSLNGSQFHFVCSTEPCVDECFVQTILASHKIVFTDPDPDPDPSPDPDPDIPDLVLVNDTVIGDPLFTVPILVSDEQLEALDLTSLSMCYEVHGIHDRWFNLVTDKCTSINAHYFGISDRLNIIDEIGVRAVDGVNHCANISVSVNQCSAEINNTPVERYSRDGVSVRKYSNRVRISVPNCNDLTLVMWVICQKQTLDQSDGSITADMIKFVVMRGLNSGHSQAHGLIGQFWNIPVDISPFAGDFFLSEESEKDLYTVTLTTAGTEPRSFPGEIFSLTWERERQPCLYVGNAQSGPIYEVVSPNDGVLASTYRDYAVESAFSEENYNFGKFSELQCLD